MEPESSAIEEEEGAQWQTAIIHSGCYQQHGQTSDTNTMAKERTPRLEELKLE